MRDFNKEIPQVTRVYEKMWSDMKKEDAINMVYDFNFATPPDITTFGSSILCAIDGFYDRQNSHEDA
jgi:hypothetical protein